MAVRDNESAAKKRLRIAEAQAAKSQTRECSGTRGGQRTGWVAASSLRRVRGAFASRR